VTWFAASMPGGWQLAVETLFSRPGSRDHRRTLGEFALEQPRRVVSLRRGQSYDIAGRMIRLANARSYLRGKQLPLDQIPYELDAVALLPDLEPERATKRFGPFVETCRAAGVEARPFPLRLVFAAALPGPPASKRGLVAGRLATLLSRLAEEGLLFSSPVVDFLEPGKESVFPKRSSLKRTKPSSLTAELWIDACLFILELEFETLTSATLSSSPVASSAAFGPSGGAPGGRAEEPADEGDDEGDDEGPRPRGSDPIQDALDDLWDVVNNPPAGGDHLHHEGDLEGEPAPTPAAEPPREPRPTWDQEAGHLPPLEDPCSEADPEPRMFGGSYRTFRYAKADWGVRIDAARTFGKAAAALRVLVEQDEDTTGAAPSASPMHPLHKWASDVLATLLHEWYHHLEDLTLATLELLGVQGAWSDYNRWYQTKAASGANRNEELAEAYAFDHLTWLTNLDRDYPGRPLRERHWRDQQLRRYGLGPDANSALSVRLAVRATEEESRSNAPPYCFFDQHRRAEPRWGFQWRPPRPLPLPSPPPSTPDRRAGPPTANGAFWVGGENICRQSAAGGGWPGPFSPGYFSTLLAGVEESYAPTFNSRVPVRFSQLHDNLQATLLRALVVLGQKHNKQEWRGPL